MQLPRRVQDELLDGLAATDPVAERSRRDLQRVHRFMRTRTPLVPFKGANSLSPYAVLAARS